VKHHPYTGIVFLGLIGVIAVTALITGAVLAANDYSSAGAFAVASACVGVLATLAGQKIAEGHYGDDREHH
jgi:hypothetical protein